MSTDDRQQELWVCRLGTVDYLHALALQEQVRGARQAGVVPDTMLLLEHPRVYTRGRRSAPGELSLGEDFYRSQGIEIVEVNRGGKITYHGPGQLVGYPIVAVDDVVEYVRTLERALVAALHEEGVAARARPRTAPTTPASGSRIARSPRSASTSSAASRRTGSRSTSTTT